MATMTRTEESTAVATRCPTLLLAFELSERVWKLGFTTGLGQRPRLRQIPARAADRILEEIARAKVRFRLPATTPVVSCYEAGREAFWLHRWLVAHGVSNHVIDSSSIEVNRRARRAKTDRLDLEGLLHLLTRYHSGERRVWRVVRVPSVEEEDTRQLHRTRETLQQDRTRMINRLNGLMTTQGLVLHIGPDVLTQLETARLWDGNADSRRAERPPPAGRGAAHVPKSHARGRGRGTCGTCPDAGDHDGPVCRGLAHATWNRSDRHLDVGHGNIFGWREIKHRRQLGGLVGVVPAPDQSGESTH